MKDEWISIEERLPEEYKTVLTQHIEDLYPVSAYRIRNTYIRETEGPEDQHINGKNEILFRTPTHWMPLPNPPKPSNL